MSADIKVRDMSMNDIPAVSKLESEIFDSPWSEDTFRHELRLAPRAVYLVAEVEGRLLGYLGSQLVGREVHMTNMAVAPGFRRRGIGTALMRECIRRAPVVGAGYLSLEVREGNREAREFYRLFGFHELGLRKGYYADSGEDAVIMTTGDVLSPDYRSWLTGLDPPGSQREGDG